MSRSPDIFDAIAPPKQGADIFDRITSDSDFSGDIFDQIGQPRPIVAPATPPPDNLPAWNNFRPGKIDLNPSPKGKAKPGTGDLMDALKGTQAFDRAFPALRSNPQPDLSAEIEASRLSPAPLQDAASAMGPDPLAFGSGFVKGAARAATGGVFHPPVYGSEASGATLGQFAGGLAPAAFGPMGLSEVVPAVMAGLGFLNAASDQSARQGGVLPSGELNPAETGAKTALGGVMGSIPGAVPGSLPVRVGSGGAIGALTAAADQAITQLAREGKIDPKDPEAVKNVVVGLATGMGFGAVSHAAPASREIEYRPGTDWDAALSQGGREIPSASPEPLSPSGGPKEAPSPSQPAKGDIFDQLAKNTAAGTAQAQAVPTETGTETKTKTPASRPIVTKGAPAAPEAPAEQPLWEMSPDELEQAYRRATASDDEILIELFGAQDAKRYKGLERISNGSGPGASAAFKDLEAMQNRLTEAQQNRLFGIGETGPGPDEIKAYRDGLHTLDDASPEDLGRSLQWALTRVGTKTDPAEMNTQERVAFAQLRHAGEIIREKGWNSNDVSQAALKAAAGRFSDPEDALFMLDRFLARPKRSQVSTAPSSPALSKPPQASQPSQEAFPLSELNANAEPQAPRAPFLPAEPPSQGGESKSVSPPAPREAERSFPKTLEENNLPGGEDRTYTPKGNAETVDIANREIDAAGIDKSIEDVVNEPRPSAEHTAKGILLIKRLQAMGDKAKATSTEEAETHYAKAIRVASELSKKLTEQGQAIQAASIVSRLSPDGIVLYAQRQIRKANAERLFPSKTPEATITPAQAFDLRNTAKKVQDLEGYVSEATRIGEIIQKAGKQEALSPEDVAALHDFKAKIQGLMGEPAKETPAAAPKAKKANQKTLTDTLIEALDKKEQAARARLRARGYRLYSGIPLDDVADFAIIGASKIAKQGIRYADWASSMAKDFGEEIRPHLVKIYTRAQEVLQQEKARAARLASTARAINAALEKIDTNTTLGADQARALGDMVEQIKTLSGTAKIEASQELQAALQALSKPSLGQRIASAQTIAQLLNPKTAIRNVIGNEIFFRMERLSKMVATPIDMARSKITGGDREITFRTEGQGDYWKAFMSGARAAVKGVSPEGIQSKYDLAPPAFSSKYNPLTYLERAMGVELKAFDYASYMRARNQTLGELASLRADQFKVPKAQRAAFVKQWIQEADDRILQIADEYGKYATFQDDTGLSQATHGIKQALNKATYAWQIENPRFGLGDIILKYPKTPANIFLRALDYSPAGFMRSAYLIAEPILKGGTRNVREIEMSLARAITGSMGFTGMGYYLASKGVISGQAEKDKDVRAFKAEQTGERNYQVNISALERWARSGFRESSLKKEPGDLLVSYDWAQPVSQSIATAATLNQEVRNKKSPIEGAANIAAAGAGAGLESLSEQPFLQGIGDLFGGTPNTTTAERLGRILEGVPASFTPGILNQLRQATSNRVPETYSPNPAQRALNKVIARLPFVSKILPNAYKTLGASPREQYQNGSNSLFNVFLNPAFVAKYNLDPVVQAVLTPYEAEGRTKQFPQVAKKTLRYLDPQGNKKELALSGDDLSRLQRLMGMETEKAFMPVSSSQLGKMPFADQEAVLAKLVNQAADRARKLFLIDKGIQYTDRGIPNEGN